MNTTSTPQYMAARNKANYKVTAKATVFNVHQKTNMIVGTCFSEVFTAKVRLSLKPARTLNG
jgi:hypothetical protein